MKKIGLTLVLLCILFGSGANATLTPTKIPVTKTGGSTPVLQDGIITDTGTNVGIGSTAPGQALDVNGTIRVTGMVNAGSHVTTVPCASDLSTFISNATSGDTLQLGACSYSIGTYSNNKGLTLAGQGKYSTTINATGHFTQTADNFTMENLNWLSTNGGGIDPDCRSGTTCTNINLINVNINVAATAGTAEAIFYTDAGGEISNITCQTTDNSPTNGAADFSSCLFKQNTLTQEINSILTVRNSNFNCLTTSGSGNTSGTFTKCIENWTDTSSGTPSNTSEMDLINVNAKSINNAGASNARALTIEGPNNITNVYGGSWDGSNALSGDVDILISTTGGNPTVNLYGPNLVNGLISDVSNLAVYYGGYFASGLNFQPYPSPSTINVSPAAIAPSMIVGTGAQGGATSITTTGVGGIGSNVNITLGKGGLADAANTSSTGGKGGSFTFTAGLGGPSNVATGTNAGGNGGDISILGGNGGVSGNGSTATGGNGGNLYLEPGNLGIGTNTNGSTGSLYLLSDSSFHRYGKLKINNGVNNGPLTTTPLIDVRATDPTTDSSMITFTNYAGATNAAANIALLKSRGNETSPTVVSSGDHLGTLYGYGYDGAVWRQAAAIEFDATNNVGIGTGVPGRIGFDVAQTTAKVQRMFLDYDGSLNFPGNFTATVQGTRNPNANSAGLNMFITGASATSGATDKAGADISLSAGTATGTGQSNLKFLTSTPQVSTNTTDNAPTQKMVITGAGNVGIGSITPGTTLDVTGTVRMSQQLFVSGIGSDSGKTDATVCEDTTTHQFYDGSGTLGVCLGTSSARYKHDINPLGFGLNEVNKLKPVTFFYKNGYGDNGVKLQYGLLAEDVNQVLPNLVALDVSGKPNSVDLLGTVPVLINAVQQQQHQINLIKLFTVLCCLISMLMFLRKRK